MEPDNRPAVFVERLPTAHETIATFWAACRAVSGTDAYVVMVQAVGLRCDGRRSTFDMFYFPGSGEMLAVDTRDAGFVCRVPCA